MQIFNATDEIFLKIFPNSWGPYQPQTTYKVFFYRYSLQFETGTMGFCTRKPHHRFFPLAVDVTAKDLLYSLRGRSVSFF